VRRKVEIALRVGAIGHSPLHDSPLDLEEGEADRRLPVLGTFEDEIVERVADLGLSVARGRA
jgi:hypothetical protein